MNFEYKIGDIKTNTPWFRPDKKRLKNWYLDFQQIPGTEKYSYLAGDSLLNTETWDADIIVVGKINDYLELKNLLVEGIKLGFKHLQLVDIFYLSNTIDYEKEFQPFYKIRPWKGYTKIRKGKVETEKEFRYTKEIIEGLFKIQHDEPPKSYFYWKEMYNKGIYPNSRRTLEEVLN
jgi:hypothetical protein